MDDSQEMIDAKFALLVIDDALETIKPILHSACEQLVASLTMLMQALDRSGLVDALGEHQLDSERTPLD